MAMPALKELCMTVNLPSHDTSSSSKPSGFTPGCGSKPEVNVLQESLLQLRVPNQLTIALAPLVGRFIVYIVLLFSVLAAAIACDNFAV